MSLMEPTHSETIQNIANQFKSVFEHYAVQKVILFGSHARRENTRRSDIDLIIIQETDKRFFDRYDGLLLDLNRASILGAVELLIYTPEELQSISHRPFIARALREGKVIYECKQKSF